MKRGFTLIEMLAVVVLISLVATIGSVSLVAGTEQAQLNSMVVQWHDMDAQARSLAQTGQSVLMSIERERHAIQLRLASDDSAFSRFALPNQWSASITIDEQETDTIVFDTRGRTPDYEANLYGKELKRIKTWRICGLTGWIAKDESVR